MGAFGTEMTPFSLIERQRHLFELTVECQLLLLIKLLWITQQPAKEVSCLEALTSMEQRISETVAIELAKRVELIHISKIKEPDKTTVIDDIAGTEIPLHQPGLFAGDGGGEDLPEYFAIKTV